MHVKICGLSTAATVDATVNAGASYIGFVFFPKSPRYVTVAKVVELAPRIPTEIRKVALTVNASDAELENILKAPIDMLQLHGAESPARVAEVKARFGLPVMKAIGVADESDLALIDAYSGVADQLLVDTKPPKDGALPGGNGVPFDWRLIAGREWSVPWMLAGGLTAENVAEAVSLTGAQQIDLSSAVESSPGVKDVNKIAAFIRAAKGVE